MSRHFLQAYDTCRHELKQQPRGHGKKTPARASHTHEHALHEKPPHAHGVCPTCGHSNLVMSQELARALAGQASMQQGTRATHDGLKMYKASQHHQLQQKTGIMLPRDPYSVARKPSWQPGRHVSISQSCHHGSLSPWQEAVSATRVALLTNSKRHAHDWQASRRA
jgi:hypothetical protein